MTADQHDLNGEPVDDTDAEPDRYQGANECDVCGETVRLDGREAIEHGGQVICKDCTDVPVAFRAICDSCTWSVTQHGREMDRYAVRQLTQSDANTHEMTQNVFEDEDHETRWREVTPGSFDYEHGKYDGYTMPRGPMGNEPNDTIRGGHGPAPAIGFCSRCWTNARETTGVRGVFDCPGCTYSWYDTRVGEQPYSFDDYFTSE